MTTSQKIIGNFPKTIDKNAKNFKAVINPIIDETDNLLKYMQEWVSTPSIYEQSGEMLKKTVVFFTYLKQFVDETEISLKNRIGAIFVRNHDTKWGTPFDVKNVFSQYFPSAKIYLVENTNKIDDSVQSLANLLVDGDIETDNPSSWTLNNCSATKDSRFSKTYGIEMNQSGGLLSQTVSVTQNTYFLHFFLKGKINVIIKSNHNKYWDYKNQQWSTEEVKNEFSSNDWNNQSLFFITNQDDNSVTISFEYVDTLTYLDYFRLFEKQPYPSFTIIAQFDGYSAVNAFGLASGDADPNVESAETTPPQPRYGNYGYYDKSFLSGVAAGFAKDVYEDLLNYLRSVGVKAYLEIITRDYIE